MSSSYNRRTRRGANPVPGPTPQPGSAMPELEEGSFTDRNIIDGVNANITQASAMAGFLPVDQQIPFVWNVLTSSVVTFMETILAENEDAHEQMELMVREEMRKQSAKRAGVREARAAAAANPPGEDTGMDEALRAEKLALRAVTDDVADPDREMANRPAEPLLGPADDRFAEPDGEGSEA